MSRPASDGIFTDASPIGGTSAGMMILSGFNYIAYPNTINSAQALANPYLADSTSIKGDFWNSSANGSVWSKPTPIGGLDYFVSDSHFAVRDRMGRLTAFLARLSAADAGSYGLNLPNWYTPRAIGVDQETAVLLDATSVSGMLTSPTGTTLTNAGISGEAQTGSGSLYRQGWRRCSGAAQSIFWRQAACRT